jgi:hypothetical protein
MNDYDDIKRIFIFFQGFQAIALIYALQICNVMGPHHLETRNLIEKFTRLYLLSLHSVCTNLGKYDVFLSVWNTSSLLNIGRTVEQYGHPSSYWEGGLRDEAIIQKFKSEKCLFS